MNDINQVNAKRNKPTKNGDNEIKKIRSLGVGTLPI